MIMFESSGSYLDRVTFPSESDSWALTDEVLAIYFHQLEQDWTGELFKILEMCSNWWDNIQSKSSLSKKIFQKTVSLTHYNQTNGRGSW